MRAADTGLPGLHGPVDYSGTWTVVLIALPALVLGYYLAVTWWARPRPARAPRVARADVRTARAEHLARLARIRARVAADDLTARHAHQEISATVRSYVAAVRPVNAASMSLEDLRAARLRPVAGVIELVYPPQFRPGDQGRPEQRLGAALDDAERLVATWS